MTITTTDTHLAAIYYGVLLEHASTKPITSIRYKEVIERARELHPNDSIVDAAIPVSIGRRLDVIVYFVGENNLPPLTCIVVNDSGKPGPSYQVVNGSWEADMSAVGAYDWKNRKVQWDSYIQKTTRAATKLKRRTDAEAAKIMFDEYRAGRIPYLMEKKREQLVALLMEGLPVEEATQEIRKA